MIISKNKFRRKYAKYKMVLQELDAKNYSLLSTFACLKQKNIEHKIRKCISYLWHYQKWGMRRKEKKFSSPKTIFCYFKFIVIRYCQTSYKIDFINEISNWKNVILMVHLIHYLLTYYCMNHHYLAKMKLVLRQFVSMFDWKI